MHAQLGLVWQAAARGHSCRHVALDVRFALQFGDLLWANGKCQPVFYVPRLAFLEGLRDTDRPRLHEHAARLERLAVEVVLPISQAFIPVRSFFRNHLRKTWHRNAKERKSSKHTANSPGKDTALSRAHSHHRIKSFDPHIKSLPIKSIPKQCLRGIFPQPHDIRAGFSSSKQYIDLHYISMQLNRSRSSWEVRRRFSQNRLTAFQVPCSGFWQTIISQRRHHND